MSYYKVFYLFMDSNRLCHLFIKAQSAENAKDFFLEILDDNSFAYNIRDVIEDDSITEDDVCLNFNMEELLLRV